ncbi:MAG: hypothetical protein LBC69_01025 [Eubacteriaceae bacterium]|nr:hypothetical protein [Eubacteriaceae bacterium]
MKEGWKAGETCKYRTESCGACRAADPFSADTVCTAAITLYYASGNILCPECSEGYLYLTKTKEYECDICSFSASYEAVLDSFMEC